MKRIETGPLKINDDWAGVFIRGDNALMGYAPALRSVLTKLENSDDIVLSKMQIEDLADLLETCAETENPNIRQINTSLGEIYQHKNGSNYEVIGEGTIQVSDQLVDYDKVVIYRAPNGSIWVRPTTEFFDGRFKKV